MKHWIVPSRGPGCQKKECISARLSVAYRHWAVEHIPTCFKAMGNVIFPENSGLLTISLHTSLHDLHTAAQATTFLREGQVFSLASSLRTTSNNNSGGRLAQRLVWINRGSSSNSWTGPWDLPLEWLDSLSSKLRRDKLPNPSLTSRSMLRNDI